MAEQADAPEREDDELLLEDKVEGQEPEAEEEEEPGAQDDETDDQGDSGDAEDEDEELEIHFGDEAAPASDESKPDLVNHLRKVNREQAQKLAAYERGEGPVQPQKIEVGEKPSLEACDYDADKFEADLLAWNERKRQADEANAQATQQQQAEQARFGEKLQTYGEGQKALKVRDFEAVEAVVLTGLSQVQQATLILAADDSAKLVYALGRHPEKVKALAAITNPIEFTKALVKLEGTLKVTRATRTPPEPDRAPRGSAPLSPQSDKKLEKLEAEAQRTGDRTKVAKYRKALKAQGRA